MAESTYHQMSVQHIKYLDQHRSPGLVRLVHQQPPQSHTPGDPQVDYNQALEQHHQWATALVQPR